MKYVLIFYLLAPALGYTAGINKVADTLAVKLTSLVASLRILNQIKTYQGNDVIVDLIFSVGANKLDEGLDGPFPDDSFIVLTEIFQLGQNQGVLDPQQWPILSY